MATDAMSAFIMWFHPFVFLLFLASSVATSEEIDTSGWDLLLPYASHHGPRHRSIRDTQACQHNRYGNTTYSLYPAHVNMSDFETVVKAHHRQAAIGEYFYMQPIITLRYQQVFNPQRTFSVLEPGHHGSCEEGKGLRATVQATAQNGSCMAASNAGFFNTKTGQCLGNIVSHGYLVQDSRGIQNVHFGITKSGHIFTGYLSEIELVTLEFEQLVGGVVWLVRDGEIYVDESRNIECPDIQETGTLDRFITVKSARTAVGHNAQGHILMVQVDGKTDKHGVNLHEFASLLKEMGAINAINLDGGGSATSVINHTLVNYPSDSCPNSTWNCPRQVSTILCVHSASCSPHPHCSHHGDCVSGRCWCRSPWTGEACETLGCPADCSGHGWCAEEGCVCHAGWRGENCSVMCDNSMFGLNCEQPCLCVNNSTCDPVSGHCGCAPGFTGQHCESGCGYGTFGEGCQQHCDCPIELCFCHPVTGNCSNATDVTDYMAVWRWMNLAVLSIAVISIGVNISLACKLRFAKKGGKPKVHNRRTGYRIRSINSFFDVQSAGDGREVIPLRSVMKPTSSSSELSDDVSTPSSLRSFRQKLAVAKDSTVRTG